MCFIFLYFNSLLLFNTYINYNIRRSTTIAYVASRALFFRNDFFSLHSRTTTIKKPEFGKHFYFSFSFFNQKRPFFSVCIQPRYFDAAQSNRSQHKIFSELIIRSKFINTVFFSSCFFSFILCVCFLMSEATAVAKKKFFFLIDVRVHYHYYFRYTQTHTCIL